MTIITTIATIAYILMFGRVLGRKLLPHQNPGIQLPVGVVSLFGAYSILLTIAFYCLPLTGVVYAIAALAITGVIIGISDKDDWKLPFKFQITKPSLITLAYYLGLGILIEMIVRAQTVELTTSLWELLSIRFTLTLLATIVFLIFALKQTESRFKWLHLGSFALVILNIANIVYPLGFGFDGFIHRATEQLLLSTHTITPKPLYYIGHYVLVAILHLASQLPVEFIDRVLPSTIYAFGILPIINFAWIKAVPHKPNHGWLVAFAILGLPLTLLVNPTPLALSLTLTIGCVWYGLSAIIKDAPILPLIIMTLFALAVHPLSGVAALIITVFVLNRHAIAPKNQRAANILTPIIFVGSSIILPVAFALMSVISVNKITFGWFGFDWRALIRFPYVNQLNFPLDLVYGFMNWLPVLFFVLVSTGTIQIIRSKRYELLIWIYAFGALAINAFLLISTVRFGNIIEYEQLDFALRILSISWFVAMPVMMFAISNISIYSRYEKIFALFFFTVLIASNLYISYPRKDDYQNEKFINLTRYDVAAVQKVEELNKDTSYAVLTNQVISSGAVKKFGLDHEITTNTGEKSYFYAIPTGGPLYQYYLRLVSGEDTRKVINEALAFAQTKKIVVIMTPTWKNFDLLDARFKEEAEAVYDVEGKLFVYEFVK